MASQRPAFDLCDVRAVQLSPKKSTNRVEPRGEVFDLVVGVVGAEAELCAHLLGEHDERGLGLDTSEGRFRWQSMAADGSRNWKRTELSALAIQYPIIL